MASAICTVIAVAVVTGGAVATWLLIRQVTAELQESLSGLQRELERMAADVSGTADEVLRIADVLKQASQINRAKSSVFDGDKIQEKPAQRYVPIARRRAQAEQSSMGPQNHAESVREANARAIESAG